MQERAQGGERGGGRHRREPEWGGRGCDGELERRKKRAFGAVRHRSPPCARLLSPPAGRGENSRLIRRHRGEGAPFVECHPHPDIRLDRPEPARRILHRHQGLCRQPRDLPSDRLHGRDHGEDIRPRKRRVEGQALRSAVLARVAEACRRENPDHASVALRRHAADLQVAPGRHVEEAVPALAGRTGRRANLPGREPAGDRVEAHEEPVAGRHRPGEAGAPAAAGRRVHAHSAASRGSRAESELRRLCHRPRSRSSAKRDRSASATPGFASSIAASTSGSPR